MYFIDPKLGNDAVAALKTDTKNKLHSNYSVKVKVKRGKKKKKERKTETERWDGRRPMTRSECDWHWWDWEHTSLRQRPWKSRDAPWKTTAIFWQTGAFLRTKRRRRKSDFTPSAAASVEKGKKKKKIKFCFFPSTLSLFWFLIFFFFAGYKCRESRRGISGPECDLVSIPVPRTRRRGRSWEQLQRRELIPALAEERRRWRGRKKERRLWSVTREEERSEFRSFGGQMAKIKDL